MGHAPDRDAGEPAALARVVRDRFVDRHGHEPDGVWRAPGRVNVIGEHTDYNGGRCLPIALDRATYAAIGIRHDGRVSAESLQSGDRFEGVLDELDPESINGWPAYAVGVVWAAREAGLRWPGIDIVVTSTVPSGAGLSSSAALECAVAVGVAELGGWLIDDAARRELVAIGVRAEQDVAGAPTGGLDQTVSLFARRAHALALDFATGSMTQVRWEPQSTELELLIIDTRVSHDLSDGGYGDRRQECERAARTLGVPTLSAATPDDIERLSDDRLRRRARHVITENARVDDVVAALGRNDWSDVGALLDASHRSLRDDFEVSCAELDAACAAAVARGALGARMTGGGFGGSAIALVPTAAIGAVRDAITDEFRRRDWREPAFMRSGAAASAGRVPNDSDQ